MKKVKFSGKLSLNKETVARLTDEQSRFIKGGENVGVGMNPTDTVPEKIYTLFSWCKDNCNASIRTKCWQCDNHSLSQCACGKGPI